MASSKVKIGDKFGKLTVIDKADDIYSQVKLKNSDGTYRYEKGKTKYKAWLCKCDCDNEVTVKQSYLLNKNSAYVPYCGECTQVENPNYIPTGMTEQEKKDWDVLYEYVRTNIMGYDKEQSLSGYIVTRLKGLLTGNFIANKNTRKNANYSYEVILNTFKFCSPNIHKALRQGGFRDEQHRVNYIFKVVENNINNVYMRMKNAKKAKEETENIIINTPVYSGAEYQRKTKETTNKLLDDLW